MVRLVLSTALAVVVVAPSGAHATPALDHATQVGYFTAPIGGAYRWVLECDAQQPNIKGQVVLADGGEFADGWMAGGMFVFPRNSEKGSVIQAGDRQLVFEPRAEHTFAESSSFLASGSWSDAGPGVAHVSWALWGSPATCTASVNGAPVTIRYLDGSHAFYAGPESFTGGAFAQSGGTHVSAGRAFTTNLAGGPVFSTLRIGQYGEGLLATDDPYVRQPVRECREPNGGACTEMRPHASSLSAAIFAGLDVDGGYQGELWVITLPR